MRWVEGRIGRFENVENVVAMHRDAQKALDRESRKVATKAESALAAHRHDGHAAIELDQGDVDRYVVLSDERGQAAALSIEYGRDAYESNGRKVGSMEGLFILHDAAGLRRRR